MRKFTRSKALLRRNEQWIPGGVVSLNRKAAPNICFTRGQGSHVWDLDGNEYIDYHAGFSASFLGHNDPDVNTAVIGALEGQRVLMGAGPTDLEGELAELVCRHVPTVERVQLTASGSEATYHAIRIARAATRRDHVIIMQGGYNGWHNDVAANVASPLAEVGPRLCPGEYPYDGLSGGVPQAHKQLVHVVNFNDLDSVLRVVERFPVACVITEPILQNIGLIKPLPGYLAGLRRMADEFGFLLIFDEVKTGFRYGLGGYQSLCGIAPDLSAFGKAIANGHPLGAVGGKAQWMDFFVHPDRARRVLIAGTYHAHPLATAAAIATLRKLASPTHAVYAHVARIGDMLAAGLRSIFAEVGVPCWVAQERSAFCVYFMDHEPRDYHDVLRYHDATLDQAYRAEIIEHGVFHFPLPTKQGSVSFAHTLADLEQTLAMTRLAVGKLVCKPAVTAVPVGTH